MSCKNKKTIRETHPHLMDEWDFAKNGNLRPDEVTHGSGKKVWWLCSVCGLSWEASVRHRVGNSCNCSVCGEKNRKVLYRKAITKRSGTLSNTCSPLLEEWDYNKNKNLSPDSVTPGSRKKVWWVCKRCGCSWKAFIFNRTRKDNPRGCPACAGRKVVWNNSLECNFPELSEEWNETKNNNLSPAVVTPASNKKVWWKCHTCAYEWKAYVYSRTTGRPSGCPKCSKKPVSNVCSAWLDSLGVEIREYYIKLDNADKRRLRVDGFDPKTNTVYEFLGDYWHGNPEVYDAEEINPTNKKSFGKLYQEWLGRKKVLEIAGYSVVFIWEKDFNIS